MEKQIVIPREVRNVIAQNLIDKELVEEVVKDVFLLNGFFPGVEVQVEGVNGLVKVDRVQPKKSEDEKLDYFAPWAGFTYQRNGKEEWTTFSKVLLFNSKGLIF